MYAINGMYLTRHKGGMVRFANEIVKNLDTISKPGEFVIVIPKSVENPPKFKNIQVIRFGNIKNLFWEQFDFAHYIRKKGLLGINLVNTCPFFRPDIIVIHDVVMMAHPNWYSNGYGRRSKFYHVSLFKSAFKRAKAILTVSEFSKSEIIKFGKVDPSRVFVIGNGWQHFESVNEDDGIFEKYPSLVKGSYYLSVSSLTPQKNFQWVEKTAALNPNSTFVIGGERVGLTTTKTKDAKNLFYIGRLNDGETKALMRHCKAFIHPAKYEGFGITPMEALSVGAKIIVSNASCLPEIYGPCAHYINPDKPLENIDTLLQEEVTPSKELLEKYSWERMAQLFYETVMRV